MEKNICTPLDPLRRFAEPCTDECERTKPVEDTFDYAILQAVHKSKLGGILNDIERFFEHVYCILMLQDRNR